MNGSPLEDSAARMVMEVAMDIDPIMDMAAAMVIDHTAMAVMDIDHIMATDTDVSFVSSSLSL
jgi:hypothetical protein